MGFFDVWRTNPVKLADIPTMTTTTTKTRPSSETSILTEDVEMSATIDGSINIKIGVASLIIAPGFRHEFLEKLKQAVRMADVADPKNEP